MRSNTFYINQQTQYTRKTVTFQRPEESNLWISLLHCMFVCVCVHLMKQLMVDVKLTVAFEAI